MSKTLDVLWLQSGGCGGCTMSLLCAESPDLISTLELGGIRLLWHPALSEASGEEVISLLQRIVDGEGPRSEERRVGKEFRPRWVPYH